MCYQLKQIHIIVIHRSGCQDSSEKVICKGRPPRDFQDTAMYDCRVPCKDCRCCVASTKYRLTDLQVKIGRNLPLVVFILQAYFIQELILLIEDPKITPVYISSIAALFAFVGIFVFTYWNNCYYPLITAILSATTYSSLAFVCHSISPAYPPN
ncbi:unnamed protein product [Rotaria magnacalcarata]|nr:unnamed protein product [Rotaria magnacalcarata]CAF4270250.1 unnamed protein product [Rotaria magnacalcarata]